MAAHILQSSAIIDAPHDLHQLWASIRSTLTRVYIFDHPRGIVAQDAFERSIRVFLWSLL